MADRAAGDRLKRAIHVARARANILYDTDLSVRAGVSYDTLMNWYAGKTVPRGAELRRLGQTLGVSYADLMAAYEGLEPEPQPLQAAVRELVVTVQSLVSEIREDRQRGQDAAAAILRAAQALGGRPTPGGSPASNGPPAPRETTGSK
jgi:transcriptional regulator with XRE-family HTH domain